MYGHAGELIEQTGEDYMYRRESLILLCPTKGVHMNIIINRI